MKLFSNVHSKILLRAHLAAQILQFYTKQIENVSNSRYRLWAFAVCLRSHNIKKWMFQQDVNTFCWLILLTSYKVEPKLY